ncbi:MAG: sigma-70 family RNA polymerase sigma factor [Gammaproteobacteria bacterium]|nr:sigma-70 family RNA polymerase sigma factor [Gammaproteobacteria bacterium]
MTTVPADDPWQAFEPRLRAYVSARVDTSSADDVVGDILLRLVQHRGDLEHARKPLAWIMRVATNAITDHYRRHSAERRMLARVTDDPMGSDAAAEAGDESHAELAQCLIPFIRELPEKYREALLLTEIGGLTQTSAAARLGLSSSTMKSRVQRGRARLKQALLGCCEIEVDRHGSVVDYAKRAGRRACEDC